MNEVDVSMEVLLTNPLEGEWQELENTGGLKQKKLWENPETGASVTLLDIPAGAGIPIRHRHSSNQMMYCLKGRYEYLEPKSLILEEDAFYSNPKGHYHGPTKAITDCLLLEIYDGPHYAELPPYHNEETVGKIVADD